MKTTTNHWFTIEPYVFICISNKKKALLYNTLDGVTFESDKEAVIELLQEILQEDNCGVVFLTNERFKQKDIKDFIRNIRKTYMGDIINVALSNGKPVQLVPYCNYPDKYDIYKLHNYSPLKNVLENLSEISIHVNSTTNLTKLIPFVLSIPEGITFNIIGDIGEVAKFTELLSCLNQRSSPKNILCSYENIIAIQPNFENNFSYIINIRFPIDIQKWKNAIQILLNQTFSVEYVFDVTSNSDTFQAEKFIEQYKIEKYRFNPVYIGNNIDFFEENVFLSKKDILSTSLTIKDFFSRKAMNIYDFGKINIMPNGNAYANLNHSILGNIDNDNIYEIVYKELKDGKSWFRIRNQSPCNDCIYQWLCPPPSNYEIEIGRPNLCHVNN
jgi:pseudo-rSAM protein